MALLDLLNGVQDELSLPRSSAFVSSAEITARQLLAFANREGQQLNTDHAWPALEREHTWTLTADEPNYALPGDIDRHIPETHWDRNFRWQLLGPLTPQDWQTLKSGVIASGPRRRFRVKGRADNQIFIDPTPGAGDTGQILVLEYISASWVSPRLWVTGAAFGANSYCAYDGNFYKTMTGGTAGATPPTHTSGSASDGGITWTYWTAAYDAFQADTDFPLISARAIALGVQWRYLRAHGFASWREIKDEYDDVAPREAQKLRSARTLNQAARPAGVRLLTSAQVPDQGYGS